jgi:hypothetical protein
LLGGGSLKDALKAGAMGGLTAGATTAADTVAVVGASTLAAMARLADGVRADEPPEQ